MTKEKAPNLSKEGTRKQHFWVTPDLLKIQEGFNVRKETQELRDHIDWLKENIKEHGVRQPLHIRKMDEAYFITSGHCRHRAVTELWEEGFEIKLPVIVEDPKTFSETDRLSSLINDNAGLALSIPERAEVVQRMLKYGMDVNEIAKKISKSVGHVQHLIKFLEAPEEVQEMVVEGKVSPTAAIETSYSEGADAVEVLKEAEAIANEEGKKKVTQKHINKAKTIKVPKPKAKPRGEGMFKDVFKYAETILSENDHLANYLVDTCEALQEKVREYELQVNPPEVTEED